MIKIILLLVALIASAPLPVSTPTASESLISLDIHPGATYSASIHGKIYRNGLEIGDLIHGENYGLYSIRASTDGAYLYAYEATGGDGNYAPKTVEISKFDLSTGAVLTRTNLISIPLLLGTHIGGGMALSEDGSLYASIGDGAPIDAGPDQDLRLAALDTNTLSGKVIRISADTGLPMPNNPFTTSASLTQYIYAVGFRNPFRMAIWNGTPFVADVGNRDYEEVNAIYPASSYGWPKSEGPYGDTATLPIYGYDHNPRGKTGAAITGIAFVRDEPWIADFTRKVIFNPDSGQLFHTENAPVDLQPGPGDCLYYVALTGEIYKLCPYETVMFFPLLVSDGPSAPPEHSRKPD